MKKIGALIIIIFLLLTGCSNVLETGNIQNAGLLVEGSIHDQTWGKKGYLGLLNIQENMDTNVYFKEGVNTQMKVNEAVETFANKGVNLIFGHSSSYGQYFSAIDQDYPDIQFVYFNGDTYSENITSIKFNAHAMGFFAGMVAGAMTETNNVGVLGAFEWQPEIDGFYEGVKYQNPEVNVEIRMVNHWDSSEQALNRFQTLKEANIDVIYPTGDGFSVPIVNEAKESNIYAIGYISDLIDMGESTVLTSTVQHVDRLYPIIAKKFNKGELPSKVMNFDFRDDVITMGTYSDEVPKHVRKDVAEAIHQYKETGNLPNQMN
ncbi:BMP family ABC transporter substrate-binding protein [Virgibacillus sp. MSP4-1]|uniref:BMP family ABC transporter substrate-binding protein n=1 Tax=Virgibacillus sp. MSP4-1 TaxID=2700081 RepID=UPI0003A3D376|nr:BMP family ABC transporter substrate-binding protein [Virgibacillus sp. MSP4-1]QHS21673.1 BMP family ABC transporter substrate-binding protein [Virgibacillus sp. MSP4-1]